MGQHKYRGYGLFCEYTERGCNIGKMCNYIAVTDGIYRKDKKRIASKFNYLFKKKRTKDVCIKLISDIVYIATKSNDSRSSKASVRRHLKSFPKI